MRPCPKGTPVADDGRDRAARQRFCIIDSRTGKRVSMGTWLSQEGAEEEIEEWKRRRAKGGRPDITQDLLDHMAVVHDEDER